MIRKIILLNAIILASSITFGQLAIFDKFERDIAVNRIQYQVSASKERDLSYDNSISNNILKKTYKETEPRFDSAVWYYWNTADKLWEFYWKYRQEYNEFGYLTFFESSIWNEPNQQWVYNLKHVYEYDSSGKKTTAIDSEWDTTNSKWQENHKSVYEYDASGKETVGYGYDWNNISEQWEYNGKIEYSYDDEGVILCETYYYDPNTNTWSPELKENYENNSNGNVVHFTALRWNTYDSQWINLSKADYEYNDEGNITFFISYSWDEKTSSWINSSKFELEYDSSVNKITDCSYNWSVSENKWIGSYKMVYEHNTFSEITSQYGYTWDETINNWSNEYETMCIYYYPDTHNSTPIQFDLKSIQVYPNPFTEHLIINIPNDFKQITFTLFDSNGKQIIIEENDKRIYLKDIKNGLYFYSINIDGICQTGKLLKK